MTNFILYGSIILVPLFALAFAKGSRGSGRQFALARLTNIQSVADTLDRQVRLAGKLGLTAIAFVASVLALLLFAPSGSASWAQFIGSIVSFGANLTLGLASGIGSNAAEILAKVSERDTIDAQIDMKRRTRRRLGKFLSVIVIVVLLSLSARTPAIAAEGTWVWLIDITDSVDPTQRDAAIAAMLSTALDNGHTLNVETIVVVKFSDEDFLSEMTWVSIPPVPKFDECRRVQVPLTISKSWISLSPTLLSDAKQEAVKTCLARQDSYRMILAEDVKRFSEQLQQATRVTPRADGGTRIVPLLQALLARPYMRAVDLVTDLQDQSGLSPESLNIPDTTPVTVVLVRPNPRRSAPNLRQVLATSERWSRIKGITVTSAAEYRGYAHSAGKP